MIYVISDIHGQYVKFKQMLELIKFSDEDQLFVLGDVVDRGNSSIKTLRYVMSRPNIKMLVGNHEKMMIDALRGDAGEYLWYANGGYHTMNELSSYSEIEQDKYLDFIASLELTHELQINNQTYLLCHAGIRFDKDIPLINREHANDIVWMRDEFYYFEPVPDKYIVIFGHTPTKNISGKWEIWRNKNKICIDCGAAYGGKLACLRLNDMQEFYI